MSNDILNAIYNHYVNDAFEGIQALTVDDLKDAYASLDEFEKKHNVSLSEHNALDFNVLSVISGTSEQKGFINGFKLAARLIFEVWGTSSYYIKQEKAERT